MDESITTGISAQGSADSIDIVERYSTRVLSSGPRLLQDLGGEGRAVRPAPLWRNKAAFDQPLDPTPRLGICLVAQFPLVFLEDRLFGPFGSARRSQLNHGKR